jgi:Uma2 family endonuclease
MVTTQAEKLTFGEWLHLPETKERYEIVDGVMYMAAAATYAHQLVQRRVNFALTGFVLNHQLGEVLTAPLDILVQREPLRTRQPDILYLSPDKVPGETLAEVEGIKFLEVSPDISVEILSPSNTRAYMEIKLRDYQAIGVTECWIFDPSTRTASVLDLTGGQPRAVATLGINEVLRSGLLPGFELSLGAVFR